MKRLSVLSSMSVLLCSGSFFACSSSNGGASSGAGGVSGGGAPTTLPTANTGGTAPAGGGSSTMLPSSGAGMGATMIPPLGSGGATVFPPASGGRAPTGGAPNAAGGMPTAMGGAPAGAGGSTAPTTCMSTSPVGPTIFGMFPQADPSKKGPIATTTDMNVGPGMAYTMFRPADLTKNGPLFPVITWGNGTGTTPSTYGFLLGQLASHGFIVIASNSMNVAQGTPPPMLDGVTWVFQQNCDSTSPLYQHVDTAHVGATGHSQGAFATMTAGTDPRIVVTAPIEGSLPAKLNGPSLLLCGGMDTTVGCMGAQSAFSAITGVPLLYGELLPASHTSWITDSITAQFGGGATSPFVTAVVAWMRVFLMNDTSLKPMFYGADCTLCKDTTNWTVMQKGLN